MDKHYITALTAEDYMKKTGDDAPFKYQCMECGCIFYGRWHSNYTIGRLQCPTCKEDTDPLFIKYIVGFVLFTPLLLPLFHFVSLLMS